MTKEEFMRALESANFTKVDDHNYDYVFDDSDDVIRIYHRDSLVSITLGYYTDEEDRSGNLIVAAKTNKPFYSEDYSDIYSAALDYMEMI